MYLVTALPGGAKLYPDTVHMAPRITVGTVASLFGVLYDVSASILLRQAPHVYYYVSVRNRGRLRKVVSMILQPRCGSLGLEVVGQLGKETMRDAGMPIHPTWLNNMHFFCYSTRPIRPKCLHAT